MLTSKQKQLISEIEFHRYKRSKLKISLSKEEFLLKSKIKTLFNDHMIDYGIHVINGMLAEIESSPTSFSVNEIKVIK